jgi:hypothetical protein
MGELLGGGGGQALLHNVVHRANERIRELEALDKADLAGC